MRNIGGSSRFIGFFDECRDHSMDKIDRDFPLFVLSFFVIHRKVYVEQIIPAISDLKLCYWNHEGINLHSRDIRKHYGPFSFLQVPDKRAAFYKKLNGLMDSLPYTLFLSCIKK